MCKKILLLKNKKSLKFVWKVIKLEEMVLKIVYYKRNSKRFQRVRYKLCVRISIIFQNENDDEKSWENILLLFFPPFWKWVYKTNKHSKVAFKSINWMIKALLFSSKLPVKVTKCDFFGIWKHFRNCIRASIRHGLF